jgi:hypothetical protein
MCKRRRGVDRHWAHKHIQPPFKTLDASTVDNVESIRSDPIDISVFEQKIHGFPGFCEQNKKSYPESSQNLRIFHITTPLDSPHAGVAPVQFQGDLSEL